MNTNLWNDGEKYQEKKMWKDALRCYLPDYDNAVKNKDYKKLNKIAWCYSCNHEYKLAIPVIEEMLIIYPDNGQARNMLAYQYYALEKWTEAIDCYRKTLEIFTDFHEGKFKIAYALMKSISNFAPLSRREFYEAYDLYTDIINDLNNKDKLEKKKKVVLEKSYYQRSKLNYVKEDFTEATNDAKIAATMNPLKADYQYIYAKSLVNLNEFDTAYEISKKIKHYKAYNDLIVKIEEKRDPLKALKHLEKIKSPYTKLKKLELLLLSNQYIEALNHAFKVSNRIEKNHLHKFHFLVAKCMFELELYKTSRKYSVKAFNEKMTQFSSEYVEAKELITMLDTEEYVAKIKENEDDLIDEYLNPKVIMRKTATINNFNKDKSFGFIDYLPDNIFFHKTEVEFNEDLLLRGQKVTFEIVQSKKYKGKYEAKKIKISEV